jgi:mRNA interferase MazF
MPVFEPGDIIKVPFPYAEQPVKQFRPVLVVSSTELQEVHGLLWVLMITSAARKSWAGDLEIEDLEGAGLPVPSVIRCAKMATIESHHAERIGSLSKLQLKLVTNMLTRICPRRDVG